MNFNPTNRDPLNAYTPSIPRQENNQYPVNDSRELERSTSSALKSNEKSLPLVEGLKLHESYTPPPSSKASPTISEEWTNLICWQEELGEMSDQINGLEEEISLDDMLDLETDQIDYSVDVMEELAANFQNLLSPEVKDLVSEAVANFALLIGMEEVEGTRAGVAAIAISNLDPSIMQNVSNQLTAIQGLTLTALLTQKAMELHHFNQKLKGKEDKQIINQALLEQLRKNQLEGPLESSSNLSEKIKNLAQKISKDKADIEKMHETQKKLQVNLALLTGYTAIVDGNAALKEFLSIPHIGNIIGELATHGAAVSSVAGGLAGIFSGVTAVVTITRTLADIKEIYREKEELQTTIATLREKRRDEDEKFLLDKQIDPNFINRIKKQGYLKNSDLDELKEKPIFSEVELAKIEQDGLFEDTDLIIALELKLSYLKYGALSTKISQLVKASLSFLNSGTGVASTVLTFAGLKLMATALLGPAGIALAFGALGVGGLVLYHTNKNEILGFFDSVPDHIRLKLLDYRIGNFTEKETKAVNENANQMTKSYKEFTGLIKKKNKIEEIKLKKENIEQQLKKMEENYNLSPRKKVVFELYAKEITNKIKLKLIEIESSLRKLPSLENIQEQLTVKSREIENLVEDLKTNKQDLLLKETKLNETRQYKELKDKKESIIQRQSEKKVKWQERAKAEKWGGSAKKMERFHKNHSIENLESELSEQAPYLKDIFKENPQEAAKLYYAEQAEDGVRTIKKQFYRIINDTQSLEDFQNYFQEYKPELVAAFEQDPIQVLEKYILDS